MNFRLVTLLIVAPVACASAADQISAMAACQALSKTQQRSLARLSAKGGKPSPELWTVVVHDPKAPKGVRECTVSSGTIISSRTKSELVGKISKTDVIGLEGLRVDSDQVAELAAGYAEANQVVPSAFDYDLQKNGEDAAPLWTVTAFDESGARLGALIVAANTGALISHEGFAQAPEERDLTADVASTTPPEEPDAETPETEDAAAKSATTKKRTPSTSSSSKSSGRSRPSTFRRVGGRLQKFFTGKNTIGR